MPISQLCQNLGFLNFGDIGICFVEFAFGGDLLLAGLMIMAVFVGFVVRYNMPGNILLPLATALTYLLYVISGGTTIFLFLFILTLIINGVLIVVGILNYLNR
jgi:hypothetical protein